MRLIGCDLHAGRQSIAMLDRDTGVVIRKTLTHEDGTVGEFCASIPPPVVVGIEATSLAPQHDSAFRVRRSSGEFVRPGPINVAFALAH